MSDNQLPAKRAREEGGEALSLANCERSKEFWYKDGSIILRAEDALFRVSGEHLARYSSVFKDMLAAPQPPGGDTFDGVPVVVLQDTVSDVKELLESLFDPFFFRQLRDNLDPKSTNHTCSELFCLETLINPLRLSGKYLCHQIRQEVLRLLENEIPYGLRGDYNQLYKNGIRYEDIETGWTPRLVYLAAACEKHRALHLVPTILAALAFQNPDGPASTSFEVSGSIEYPLFTRYLIGCQKLKQWTLGCLASVTYDAFGGCDTCQKSAQCGKSTGYSVLRELLDPQSEDYFNFEIFEESTWKMLKFCDPCLSQTKQRHSWERKKLWEYLPGFFGMGTWEELEALRKSESEADGL